MLIEPGLFEQAGRIDDLSGVAPAYILLWFCDSSFKKKDLSNQQKSFFFHKLLTPGCFQNRFQSVVENKVWT